MSEVDDRPSAHHWPPILYVAAFVAASLLHWLLPLPALIAGPPARWIGWPLFAVGLALGLAGIGVFRSVGTTFDPTGRAKALATGGIYRVTRNPMYLGAVVGFVGLGLALGVTWYAVAAPVLGVALTRLAIRGEEAYLARRFGADYVAYKGRVRRWL